MKASTKTTTIGSDGTGGVKRAIRFELLLPGATIKASCSQWVASLNEEQIEFAVKWFETNLRNLTKK